MPSPIDLLLSPVALAIFAIYATFIVWEAVAPARALPAIRGWRWKGIAAFLTFLFVSSYLPMLWDRYLAAWQLVDLTHLGVWGGATIGFVLYELGQWLWHRSLHRSNTLWRVFHQLHHSAERLDAFGAFYFSPLDMIGWTALASLVLVLGVGIVPEAATIVVIATNLLSVFQHSNIRTPRWLGYVVQRPESHTVHHARGIHGYNYSDLACIDILFGTWSNPAGYEHETGFYQGASSRVWEMLTGKDVSRPARPPRATASVIGGCGAR